MFKELSDSEKKVLRIWGIVGGTIFLGLVAIAIVNRINPAILDFNGDYKFKIVKDETRYYTVANAMTKYSSYINSKDSENVLTILDENFKKSNNVNKDNVLEKVGNFDKTISIIPSYMCSRKKSENVTQYIFSSTINDIKGEAITKKNYSVYLDASNMTYSVEEITDEYLGGNCK